MNYLKPLGVSHGFCDQKIGCIINGDVVSKSPVPAVILTSKPLVIFFTIFVLNSPWPSFSDDHP